MAERAPYRTRQQMAILRHLQSTPGEHHTIASLKSFFDTQSVSIGTATIYRQMEKLIEEGLVRKYTLDAEESACYEYVGTSCSQAVPHFHCKCEKCGHLIHLSCDELSSIREHLLEHHGFLRQNNVFRYLSEMSGTVPVLKVTRFPIQETETRTKNNWKGETSHETDHPQARTGPLHLHSVYPVCVLSFRYSQFRSSLRR